MPEPDHDDLHARLVQWVNGAEWEGREARERSERDRDYYDGFQITPAEASALEKRKQPVIAFNLTQGKVDYLLGLEKQQRTDPKAYPRNPGDDDGANAATDAIRYVCDLNTMPQIASGVWENQIIEGAGGCDVCVEKRGDGFDVVIHRVHWDRMIWDSHSRERSFEDGKFRGTVIWMDKADIPNRWPDAPDNVASPADKIASAETYDDKPRNSVWTDHKRDRVKIIELYWDDGGRWMRGVFTAGGWLEEAAESPYVDEHGKPECPLIFVSGYVDRENKRYGAVRALIDPQDEINKRHQKAVHLLSVRQVIAEQGAVKDVDDARRQVSMPDGYVEVAPGMRFEISETGDLANGQAQLLQEAKSVFQTMGPNASLLGKQGSEASGKAIALSQQGGQMEIGALLDVHRDWRRRVYAAIWNRIKQYWTAEKWVRVTDDERNVRFVGLNQRVIEIDPQTGQPMEVVHNNVAEMVVDIVVEEGPDVATLRQEQFATMAELAKAAPGLIPPDVLIEASDLRNKEKILKRLRGEEGMDGQPAQPPPPPHELIIAQEKSKADAAKFAAEQHAAQAKADQELQLERERIAAQVMMKQAEMDAEREIAQMKIDAEREAMKLSALDQQHLDGMAERERTAVPAAAPAPQPAPDFSPMIEALADMAAQIAAASQAMASAAQEMAADREVVRGPDGRAMGVRRVRVPAQ